MMRIEQDSIGKVKVPKEAYYGSFTARALENFQISGQKAPQEFKKALGLIKKAAALTNHELKELETDSAKAIIQAADEFINGMFDNNFQLDVFQAGAGTPFNMNANEIIANRANELLGKAKGSYSPITPNNHVNMAQSSNDVIPTAIRIAALMKIKILLPAVKNLSQSFQKTANKSTKILKIGRTHLQDAVPIRASQEFEAYASAIQRCHDFLKKSFQHLEEVGIGGTALGSGITTHPAFRKTMVKNLNKLTGLKLKPTRYPMELTHGMNAFVVASNSLRVLANDLIRIANDLKLLVSGPHGGLAEITMPDVEPGSSIMPGKINPSIPECVTMTSCQVIGNDQVISLAAQMGQLELNVMTPVIMFNLLWSIELLTNTCYILKKFCIDGIHFNKQQCEKLLTHSLCLATGLSPYLGYTMTADIVKEALIKKQTLRQAILSKKIMTEKELDEVLSAEKLTEPALLDQKLKLDLAGRLRLNRKA